MPSEIERKQFIEDKVMPFFNGGVLNHLFERVGNLEKAVALMKEGLDDKVTVDIDKPEAPGPDPNPGLPESTPRKKSKPKAKKKKKK